MKSSHEATKLRFEITVPAGAAQAPLDGRLLLAIATDDKSEPRMQIDEQEAKSAQLFGMDIDGLAPAKSVVMDANALGYPVRSMGELRAGDYYVQAVLNVYQTFHRGDGKVVKLPPDRGEGQQWTSKPGNLYSKAMKMHIDPAQSNTIRIALTEKMPAITAPQDTQYVKHIRMQSKLLSDFWGVPTYLGAIIVLPPGYEQHAGARYPMVIEHGHFPDDFHGFRAEPPTAKMKDAELQRAQHQYRLYQDWTAGRLPKFAIVLVQHANPYYDDSYAVNSANVGPYGDAIVRELIPELERQFRIIADPWAHAMMGGSTGGWETIADQIFYPDDFNGAWGFCPDPVDFHAYQAVDIYEDKNAFFDEGPFGSVPRPEMREPNGNIIAEMEPAVRREEVIGTHGRAAEQFAIWQAVFSPVGADGYPAQIWDAKTGAIDKSVAEYWKQHYDLVNIMQRDWKTLGPKLAGKLHFTVGDMDTWYLNNAVHMMQDFTDSAANPYKVADYEYGYGKPHCYTGGGNGPMNETNATMMQRVLPQIEKHFVETAPKAADMSWRY